MPPTPSILLAAGAALLLALGPVARPVCTPYRDPLGSSVLLAPTSCSTEGRELVSPSRSRPSCCCGAAPTGAAAVFPTDPSPRSRDQVVAPRYRGSCPICQGVKAFAWGAPVPLSQPAGFVPALSVLRNPRQEAPLRRLPVYAVTCRGPPLPV